RWRLLHDFLQAPLRGAISLEEELDSTGSISQDLELDVPSTLQIALGDQRGGAERALCLGGGEVKGASELLCGTHDPDPFSAAACRSLEKEREADFLGQLLELQRIHAPAAAGNGRNSRRAQRVPRGKLVSEL